jgi:hypothetical protein
MILPTLSLGTCTARLTIVPSAGLADTSSSAHFAANSALHCAIWAGSPMIETSL